MLKKYVLLLCLCAALFGKEWPIYRIGIHENVPYLEKGRNELLDVYYPADAKPEDRFPGVVIIHGGSGTRRGKSTLRPISCAWAMCASVSTMC